MTGRGRPAAVAVGAVAVALVAAAAGFGIHLLTRAPTYTPGSRGIGDRYFPLEGNGGYDALHYDLRLVYDPATHHLTGSDTMTARAGKNLSRFDLDLSGLRVSRVTVDGRPATYRRSGQELVVTPARGLPDGSRFSTVVSYAGVPRTVVGSPIIFGAPYGWIYTHDGALVACEPDAAHTWFPSDDHPSDKASFRFHVTVPTGTRVVANGTYLGHHVGGGVDRRSDTFEWDQPQPMATYLATVDIGRWVVRRSRTAAGIPMLTAVDPRLAAKARHRRVAALTARVTDYWARRFGRYPFSSTGAIVDDVPDIGFSLETQTRPLYGFAADPVTVSHELAHEWFGDSVSVRSWRHIWLNEGFATFGSWLWAEHDGGASTLEQARRVFRHVAAQDGFWARSIADPQRDAMFSPAVYYRGAMTLAALRHRIGDHDFFTLLRTWVRTHRYGNATTGEFTTLAERVSGEPLQRFFRVWLWDTRKPPAL
jgi:aminopeptidase N